MDEEFDTAVARVLAGLEPGDLVTYGEVAEEPAIRDTPAPWGIFSPTATERIRGGGW